MFKHSGCDVKLKKGEIVRVLNKVNFIENVKTVSVGECNVDKFSVRDMLNNQRGIFDKIIKKYPNRVPATSVTSPCKILIEHSVYV